MCACRDLCHSSSHLLRISGVYPGHGRTMRVASVQVLALMLQLMAGRRAVSDRFYRYAPFATLAKSCQMRDRGLTLGEEPHSLADELLLCCMQLVPCNRC